MESSAELAIELEALQFTYGEHFHAAEVADGAFISVQLVPRGTEDESQRFVQGQLRFLVAPSYPQTLPAMELADVKGKWLPAEQPTSVKLPHQRMLPTACSLCQPLSPAAASAREEYVFGRQHRARPACPSLATRSPPALTPPPPPPPTSAASQQ